MEASNLPEEIVWNAFMDFFYSGNKKMNTAWSSFLQEERNSEFDIFEKVH